MTKRSERGSRTRNAKVFAWVAIGCLGLFLLPGAGQAASTARSGPEAEHFKINVGLNDAWINPVTTGQGFQITVFPIGKTVFLTWFTYDTVRPPEDFEAVLGGPGHRWLTAQGPYDGDTATLTIFVTTGGVFDTPNPAPITGEEGDGTITLEFADCNSGLLSYEITSLGRAGEIPIQRIVTDNVALCETLAAEDPTEEPPPEPQGLEGITAAHNAVRAEVGVEPLTWDPQLAAIAQAWAEGCADKDEPIGLIDHNPDRSDTYPGYVGENVYGAGLVATGQEAVDLWAAEKSDYDYDTNSCVAGKACGHYTQVVWAATERVGCGLAQCNGLAFPATIVCNYSPGGNTGGRPY